MSIPGGDDGGITPGGGGTIGGAGDITGVTTGGTGGTTGGRYLTFKSGPHVSGPDVSPASDVAAMIGTGQTT